MNVVSFTLLIFANILYLISSSPSPSPLPSTVPSSFSGCDSDEFIGSEIYVFQDEYSICFKIEVFVGGNMYLDTDTTNTECTAASTQGAALGLFSLLTEVTDKTIIFEAEKPLWSGELSFSTSNNGETTDKILSNFTLNSAESIFTGGLIVPACFSPSSYPSTVPSYTGSEVPSSIPSSHPTSLPSTSPSTFRSSIPTALQSPTPSSNPSLRPRCDVDEILGKTYFFEFIDSGNSLCLKVDFFSGGSLAVDPQNLDCTEANSNPQTIISYFASFSDEVIIFEAGVLGASGWDGTFQLVKEGTEIELSSLSMDGANKTFEAILTTPSCTSPSTFPSEIPSNVPTMIPSIRPSRIPSIVPTTIPSIHPSLKPSHIPSNFPSSTPSYLPSLLPSRLPSNAPSDFPTSIPSIQPSFLPSEVPSATPSINPTRVPSILPSITPSKGPSTNPSSIPSNFPSSFPSNFPSLIPSQVPSDQPSRNPSEAPSATPSINPTRMPSVLPSIIPSEAPSSNPSSIPSNFPSSLTSNFPSFIPSQLPSDQPSRNPSDEPSFIASQIPSEDPTNSPTMSIKPSPSPSASPIEPLPTEKPSNRPTLSIKPSPTPSASLTISAAPSIAPTAVPCVDSSLELNILENGVRISQNCSWVAESDTVNRCQLVGVAAACPVTCGTCAICADPEPGSLGLKFTFLKDGNMITKDCEWVGRRDFRNRCVLTDNVCRVTCKLCKA